jgi:hypothetical protein
MERAYYSASIECFVATSSDEIFGILAGQDSFACRPENREAWKREIEILKPILSCYSGKVYFEYAIPRMGKRIDVLVIIANVVFILEFKVGADEHSHSAEDQVWDYALDLKNFHETSHDLFIAPILIATRAPDKPILLRQSLQNDDVLFPIHCNSHSLSLAIDKCLFYCDNSIINITAWENGRYQPTPTIIEAATVLYNGHSVEDISRSDASAINLAETSSALAEIIEKSQREGVKSICFVTGVPGAGKTLVGLNIANQFRDHDNELYSVYLSGNQPLVSVLIEALTRDKYHQEKEAGKDVTKCEIRKDVRSFIQIIHHFRDECLRDGHRPPIEHVTLFDEAQRAWNLTATANFMSRKKNLPDFEVSEPEYLISCMDRHQDWAVIVCLVGGGQEINTGEAGIGEWIDALDRSYQHWHIHISSQLSDEEYAAAGSLEKLKGRPHVYYKDELHLAVSMRSFRAENVSLLVKQILDLDVTGAAQTLDLLGDKYPIVITRDLHKAKKWLRAHARGSERYGLVVSSQAERLKPHAIFVKHEVNPVHWFLNDKEDVRSSYYLEDVATEFMIQGLELDWVCVTWDADFRIKTKTSQEGIELSWDHWSFKGHKWQKIRQEIRKQYLKNAYRVLLTRARQGMVIVVPEGDPADHTRPPEFYDPIWDYLYSLGFVVI